VSAAKAEVLGKASKADLPAAVFGEAFHQGLVHEAVRAELAARRRGTASTLRRGEVSMTTAKAWRQKGTGRARVGALSAPQRIGGGVAFGPKPRRYTVKMNRRARRRAFRAALSAHAGRGSIGLLDAGAFETPSTKRAAEILSGWREEGPVLVLLGQDEAAAAKSFRNLPRVAVMPARRAGVADIAAASRLVVSRGALEALVALAEEKTPAKGEGSEA
jgi:large subunit ribosomal protein L4